MSQWKQASADQGSVLLKTENRSILKRFNVDNH